MVSVPIFAAFEELGVSARATGLGGAFTAISDDPNAVYYNPAGLGQIRQSQLGAGYGKLYLGLSDESNLGNGFLSAVHPIIHRAPQGDAETNWGTVGLNWSNLHLVGAYQEDAFGLTYGRKILNEVGFRDLGDFGTGPIYAGASLKWMRRSYGSDGYTAIDPLFQKGLAKSAIGLDLGLLYRPTAHLAFGTSVRDLNQPDVGLGSTDVVPAAYRLGAAYQKGRMTVAADLLRKASDTGFALGGEMWLRGRTFAVRGGLDLGSRTRRNLNFGLSYDLNTLQADYAFVFPLAGIASTYGSHRFSVGFRFGKRRLPDSLEGLKAAEPDEFYEEALRKEIAAVRRQAQASDARAQTLFEKLEALEKAVAAGQSGLLEPSRPAVPQPVAGQAPAAVPKPPDDLEKTRAEAEKARKEAERLKSRLEALEKEKEKKRTTLKLGEEKPGVYVARPGDTLRSVAEKTLGSPDRWREIYEANDDRLQRGGDLTPGQVLIIPQGTQR